MKKEVFNEEISESFFKNDSEKIYPYCISLVATTLKEIETFWIGIINNNTTEKTLIQTLFSLLNYEILLIQQISKYYNLYMYNSDEDNIKLINQIISINKELMNKKIRRIINEYSNSKAKEKNEKIIDDQNILNYKITKFKKEDSNKYFEMKDIKTDYTNFNDFTFKEKMKSTRNNINNMLNRNSSFENSGKNNKIKETNKEENKNCSIISNTLSNMNQTNINDLTTINNFISNTPNFNNNTISHLEESINKDQVSLLYCSPYIKKKIVESPSQHKIKINLANKFMKNINDNNEINNISYISKQSKKSLSSNICFSQSTFNFKKKENGNTIPIDENPVRKVKNIILNAKSSNLLLIRDDTPTNIRILNKQRHTTHENNHRSFNFLDETDKSNFFKGKMNRIRKYKSKNFIYSNSLTNFYNMNNKDRIKKYKSNKYLYIEKNKGNEVVNNSKKPKKFVNNKERKSNQILKDGMKKMEKRLNSKDAKKELYKTKSNDSLSLIKKMAAKKASINNYKKANRNWKNYN